jgi:hypothetical protein
MASHSESTEPSGPGHNAQLFYGPSSNFAFLQQVHRGILVRQRSAHQQYHPGERDVQEGSSGLDMFMGRSIFFGTASRIPQMGDAAYHLVEGPLETVIPHEQALVFLNTWRATNRGLFPFLDEAELRDMLQGLYGRDPAAGPLPAQTKALILAVLADGALCTTETDLAEVLFARSKQVAALCDDIVTLPMIQWCLIVADYQLNFGRPNAAYLHLGTACRKALSMGLHKESANAVARKENLEKQRITIWSLYFHER